MVARILYERTDEDHFLTTAQLMGILEQEYGIKTHRQTIPSDVETLRAYGMEIQEVMSAQKRYNLISREYDLAEIKLLIDAVESAKFISKKKSEALAAKLSRMAGRSQSEKLRRNISVEDRVRYENENVYLIIDGVDVYENEDMVLYTEIWDTIHQKLPEYGFILRYIFICHNGLIIFIKFNHLRIRHFF